MIPNPCPTAAARGAAWRSAPSPSRCPPASRTARRCGWPSGARPASGAGRAARCSCTSRVAPDPRFERQGDDLHTTLTIGVAQAALGHRGRRRDPRRAAAPDDRPGHPARPRRADPRPRRAPPARPRPRRPLRPRAGGHADRPHAPSRTSCCASSPPPAARRSRPRAPGAARASSRACAPPLASAGRRYAAIAVRAAAAAQVFVDDPAHPVLSDEDAHHLGRVLRLRDGEEVVAADGRGRWARTVWRGRGDARAARRARRRRRRRRCAVRGPRRAGAHRGLRAGQGRAARVGGPEADRARHRPHRAAAHASAASCAGRGARGAGDASSGCAGWRARRPPSAGGSGCPRSATPCASPSCPARAVPGEVVLAQLSGDRPTRGPARGGGRARGRVEHRRARVGAAHGGLRAERPAGRDGGRHRGGAAGLPADGDRGRGGRAGPEPANDGRPWSRPRPGGR